MPASRVSIIEDDEALRAALGGLVRSLGHRASEYDSAEAFLAAGGNGSDCVITDVQMPGMSGIGLIQQLRNAGNKVPVIVITARTETGLEGKALASGALCVLKKPFDTKALVALLEQALKSRGL